MGGQSMAGRFVLEGRWTLPLTSTIGRRRLRNMKRNGLPEALCRPLQFLLDRTISEEDAGVVERDRSPPGQDGRAEWGFGGSVSGGRGWAFGWGWVSGTVLRPCSRQAILDRSGACDQRLASLGDLLVSLRQGGRIENDPGIGNRRRHLGLLFGVGAELPTIYYRGGQSGTSEAGAGAPSSGRRLLRIDHGLLRRGAGPDLAGPSRRHRPRLHRRKQEEGGEPPAL